MTPQPRLAFQHLDVYRSSIRFLSLVNGCGVKVPRGYAPLADQLRRAAFSVPLNIAEGSGRASPADAARHYAIARGSAMECVAILDALDAVSVAPPVLMTEGQELLVRIVQMLSKMCR